MGIGLLSVTGTIRLSQFWPDGQSDADTVIVDTVPASAFVFRPHRTAPAFVTNVFENASVIGAKGKCPVTKNGKLKIRLQGIDAPELHYPIPLEKRKRDLTPQELAAWNALDHTDFRQYFGGLCSLRLAERVRAHSGGADTIACTVTTFVDHPSDVFDVYGRFIGDIHLTARDGKHENVNQWLVENGLAFPAFYVTMSHPEIVTIRNGGRTAKAGHRGIWKQYTKSLSDGSPRLRYKNFRTAEQARQDSGPVLFPKIFRRLVAWKTSVAIGLKSGGFKKYLKELKTPDLCYLTDEFLSHELTSNALRSHELAEFVTGNFVTFEPDGVVFKEAESRLVNAAGKEITDWRIGAAVAEPLAIPTGVHA